MVLFLWLVGLLTFSAGTALAIAADAPMARHGRRHRIALHRRHRRH